MLEEEEALPPAGGRGAPRRAPAPGSTPQSTSVETTVSKLPSSKGRSSAVACTTSACGACSRTLVLEPAEHRGLGLGDHERIGLAVMPQVGAGAAADLQNRPACLRNEAVPAYRAVRRSRSCGRTSRMLPRRISFVGSCSEVTAARSRPPEAIAPSFRAGRAPWRRGSRPHGRTHRSSCRCARCGCEPSSVVITSSGGDLLARQAARDQPQDVDLAGRSVRPATRGGGRPYVPLRRERLRPPPRRAAPLSASAAELRGGLLRTQRRPVRTRLAHRPVGVDGSEDPRRKRITPPASPRVGTPSHRAGSRCWTTMAPSGAKRGQLVKHALGQIRVHPDPFPLAGAQRTGLVPDRVRHTQPAEVVHDSGPAHARQPRRP